MQKNEYNALHKWIIREYGKATKCVFCNFTGERKFEWALIKGLKYERDINNFMQLCQSCHRKYDRKTRKIENPKRAWNSDPLGMNLPHSFGSNNPCAKALIKLSKNGEFIQEYGCLADVVKDGYGMSAISHVTTGRLKSAFGFKWIYKKDYEAKNQNG